MPAIDLKKLLILINDEKDLHADLCLDLDCFIVTDEPQPFIRSVNYIINYLGSLSTATLHIGLSAQKDVFIISFLVHPLDTPPGLLRREAEETLRGYGVKTEVEIKYPHYGKILLTCPRQSRPMA